MTSESPRSMAIMTALLTARRSGAPVAQADLMEGANLEELISLLVTLNVALLGICPDGGEAILRDLGSLASRP